MSKQFQVVKRVFANYYNFSHENILNEFDAMTDAVLFVKGIKNNNFMAQFFIEYTREDGSKARFSASHIAVL